MPHVLAISQIEFRTATHRLDHRRTLPESASSAPPLRRWCLLCPAALTASTSSVSSAMTLSRMNAPRRSSSSSRCAAALPSLLRALLEALQVDGVLMTPNIGHSLHPRDGQLLHRIAPEWKLRALVGGTADVPSCWLTSRALLLITCPERSSRG